MDSTAIIVESRHRMIALSEERRKAEEQRDDEKARQLTREIDFFSVSIENEFKHIRSQLPKEGG